MQTEQEKRLVTSMIKSGGAGEEQPSLKSICFQILE